MSDIFSVDEIKRIRTEGERTKALARLRELATEEVLSVSLNAVKIAGELLALNEIDNAERIYQSVLQREPGYLWAVTGMALVYRCRGRRDQATALLLGLLEQHPNQPHVRLQTAEELRALGRLDEALSQVDTILSVQPDHLQARMQRASLLLERGDHVSALAIYESVLEDHPDHAPAHLGTAAALEVLGLNRDAISHLDRVLSENPVHLEAFARRTRLIETFGSQNFALSIDEIQRLRTEGERAKALVRLRELATEEVLSVALKAVKIAGELLVLNEIDDAERIYQSVLQREPGYLWAVTGMALVYRRRGRRDQAAALLLGLLEQYPNQPHVRLQTAEELHALGRLDEALSQVDAILSVQPDHLQARLRRASLLLEQGDQATALALYDSVLEEHPDHAAAHFQSAVALDALGRFEDAIVHLDRVLALQPEHMGARSLKASIAERTGNQRLALSQWSEAIVNFPASPEYRMKLAQLRQRLGREERAYNELVDLTERFPEYAEAKVLAGHTARGLGYRREALDWFRAAMQIQPNRARLVVECARELVHLGEFREAEECLANLSAPLAKDSDVVGLQLALLARQDDAAARENLLSMLEAEPQADKVVELVRHGWQLGFHRESIQRMQVLAAEDSSTPSSQLRIALARTFLQAGEFAGAQHAVAEVPEAGLDATESLDVADIRLELGDIAGARRALEQVNELRLASRKHLSRGQLERAFRTCHDAGQLDLRDALAQPGDPKVPRANMVPGRALQAMLACEDGCEQQARRLIAGEAEENPEFPLDRWQARLAHLGRDFPAAVEAFTGRVSGSSLVALQDAKLWIRLLIDAEEIDRAWNSLRRFERCFARRDLATERAELLRLDLRFADAVECLRSILDRDPLDETIAFHLVHALIDHAQIHEARTLIEQWSPKMPVSVRWLQLRLHWASAAYSDWEPLLALQGEVHKSASPRARIELFFNQVDGLMRRGMHDEAEHSIAGFRAGIAGLPVSPRHRARLELTCAQRLVWLARHAESRLILDRLFTDGGTHSMRDELYRISCANEAYGGGDVQRYRLHRSRIRNPRHHVQITDFRSDIPHGVPPTRVAVLLHLYYLEMWAELERYLLPLAGTLFQLYVTVSRDANADEVVRQVKRSYPDAKVLCVENRGFDIGAHWLNLDTVDLRSFDLVLLLQTKKNNHTRIGPVWRRTLLDALMGTPGRWRDNLWTFAEHRNVGMIGSGLHRNSFDIWAYDEMKRLLEMLGMPTNFDQVKRFYEHVSGTMFLIRAELLAEMHAKTRDRIVFERYENLSLRKRFDLTYAHAMERAFGMYVRWRKFEILWRV